VTGTGRSAEDHRDGSGRRELGRQVAIHGQILSRAREAAGALAARGIGSPRTAIVLGSGLAGAIGVPSPDLAVGFDEIPGFPKTSVSGHPGRMIFGDLRGLQVLVVEGRFHLYEQQGLESVRLMACFLKTVGVKELVLTTAAGALAPHLKVGEFVVVRAHLVYPLGGRVVTLGRALPAEGPPSYGLSGPSEGDLKAPKVGAKGTVFCPSLAARLESACLQAGVRFQRGVLAFAQGPCYETPAEARLLRSAGADVVSMSAAADAIAAHKEGLRVGCICCVTNSIGLWRGRSTDHGEVLRASGPARLRINKTIEKYASSSVGREEE
jgi:purine-nucleoside phosphorylase